MTELLLEAAGKHGLAYRIVPVGMLEDIRQDFEDLKRNNKLNGFQNFIVRDMFKLDAPGCGFPVRSIIAVASPTSAMTRILFTRMGKKIPLTIPSGYVVERSFFTDVEGWLGGALAPEGYHVKHAPALPHKLLAVRSGLTRYGRNNITYAEGMGSFLILAMYYSDMPCGEHEWQDIRQMDRCRGCRACLNACPTGAILEDRFLIDNERCLTNLNEGAGYPFPDWAPPAAHNCIVGCHLCQTACPLNREYAGNVSEGEEFTEEETLALLEHRPREEFSERFMQKLNNMYLTNYLDALPRNLSALFAKA